MQAFWAIYKRQIFTWFCAPIAYVATASFWLVAGLGFCRLVSQSMQEQLLLGDVLFGSVFFWSMALLSVTLITMGSFADERKSGSIEMLLTAPVTDTQVVMAKYCAAMTCYILLCAPVGMFGPALSMVSATPLSIDPATLLGGVAAILLIGAFCTAFGIMVSALMRSPATAAGVCFTGLILVFFSDVIGQALPGGRMAAVLDYLSITQHIMDFTQGIFDSRPVILYISGVMFFLFVAIKAIDARHWR
ncbi:MAG: ABC transporter permease [Kiritimatiellia bacterium]|jgi:ABC-2 type transport system permease protein